MMAVPGTDFKLRKHCKKFNPVCLIPEKYNFIPSAPLF
jgi:hypothetical protein